MTKMMIRLWLFPLGVMLLISACSSQKKTTATAPRDAIKGSWTLTDISYDGSVPLKLTLLDEGPEACLQGSEWVLPNNGYGIYTIVASKTGCTAGERKIVWSYRLENGNTIFQYKRLIDDTRAKDISVGYKFSILSASETSMSLQSEVNFEGKPFYIRYIFTRKTK